MLGPCGDLVVAVKEILHDRSDLSRDAMGEVRLEEKNDDGS